MIGEHKIPNLLKYSSLRYNQVTILRELKATLDSEGLELSLGTRKDNNNLYPHLVVQKKGARNLLVNHSSEDQVILQGLMDTLNGQQEALVMLQLHNAAKANNRPQGDSFAEIVNAIRQDAEEANGINTDKKVYLQAQLDAMFNPLYGIPLDYTKIEDIVKKVKLWKSDKQKNQPIPQEKQILFEFLKHTYVQPMQDVNGHLQLIPEENFEENAVILSSLFQDENAITAADLEELGYDASTITENKRSNIQNYNKFLKTQNGFKEIIQAVNAEEGIPEDFSVLSNQNLIEENASSIKIVFKIGLQKLNAIAAEPLDIQSIETIHSIEEEQYCNLQTREGTSLIQNSLYNTSLMLEEQHVFVMTNNLLKNFNINNDVIIRPLRVGAAAKLKHEQEEHKNTIKHAIIEACQGKAVALQISNNEHWITLCLLPYKKDGVTTIQMVAMDSTGDCGLAKDAVEQITSSCNKLSTDDNRVETSKLINLSTELGLSSSQQVGKCCGLATTLNTASILKTYMEGNKEQFNLEQFKDALLPNIFYGKKDGKNFLLGSKKTNMTISEIVGQIGGLLLKTSVFEEELRKVSATTNNVVRVKIGASTDYLNRLALDKMLKQKQPVEYDPQADVMLEVHGQKYSFTYAEIQELKNQTPVIKLLNGINDNGLLYKFLSNDRNKNLLAKYLRKEFYNGEKNNIKEFAAKLEEVKYAVEIEEDVKTKLQEVIDIAKSESVINISTWDAFVIFLYGIPVIRTVVEWFFNNPMVQAMNLTESLDKKIGSWTKYADVSKNVGEVLQKGFAEQKIP